MRCEGWRFGKRVLGLENLGGALGYECEAGGWGEGDGKCNVVGGEEAAAVGEEEEEGNGDGSERAMEFGGCNTGGGGGRLKDVGP